MNKKFSLIFLILFTASHTFAQRNNFKLLSYTYNSNFNTEGTINSDAGIEFYQPNHAFSIGYERTLGDRVAVGLTIHFPYSRENEAGSTRPISNGDYNFTSKMTGFGWSYDSKYFVTDHDEGAPDGGYFGICFSRYTYTLDRTYALRSSPPPTTNYSGSYKNEIAFTKIGFKYGREAVSNHFLVDYYFGIDMAFPSSDINENNPPESFGTDPYSKFGFTFGFLLGFSL
ncbi:MAG: hypothetical protein WC760_08085 [Bacteroidia bacterium]|jgi:hypothetical protein